MMDYKTIENEYKPLQMWAWNEKLSTDYTLQHIEAMNTAGLGGFCINAQSGLATRYMGDEWFRNISAAITQAKEAGLSVWISDENGSPSGSGNGVVNSAGLEYQQKFLRCESGEGTNDRTIIYKDGYHFYYDVNPYYIDVLNRDAAQLFIAEAYVPYADKFAEVIDGIFSFDPQLGYGSIPWSFTLPAAYKDAYGEELLDVLPELFRPVGDYKNTRIKYWALVSKLFSENFLSTIYKWCDENKIKYSALLLCRDTYAFTAHGSAVMQFMNMHIPAIDIISKEDSNPLPALMASSIAHQFDKERSTAFLFSKAGHSSSFADLKQAVSIQFARGIGGLSSAYESSSLRGMRKRTNSSHSYLRAELQSAHSKFNEYVSRISKALSSGKVQYDTLLLSNQSAIWSCYDSTDNDDINKHYDAMLRAINTLEKKHIPFHIGDELIMREHAYVDGDTLCIGSQRYKTIVLPENAVFLESTDKLLSEFEHGGGFIALADSVPSNSVCDNENLLYTSRVHDEYRIHYFYNNSDEEFTAAVSAGSKMLDISSGDILPFYGVYRFSPHESIIVINDSTPELSRPFKKPLKTLDISGEWNLERLSPNTIVLDRCDTYFNGELAYENINAADVTELAYSLKEPIDVECRFELNITALVDDIFLTCEAPQEFTIKINDVQIGQEICGTFIDRTFPLIEIAQYLTEGKNEISISTSIAPSDEFLNARELAANYKSELNRITYDIEFEPLYIVGSFSVKTDGEFRKLDKNAYRYIGDFSVDTQKTQYNIAHLEQQGLAFFAGEITLSRIFNLSDTQYAVKFLPKGISAIQFEVNGEKASPMLWQPYELDLSDLLVKGDNEIKITLTSPLRNLLGPHHIPMGELYTVNPGDFYMHKAIWNNQKETPWENNYCFIESGIDVLE